MKQNLSIIITKLEGGGAERMASNLSILLSEKYNVFLIVFDSTEIKYPYEGQLIDLNIPASNNSLSRLLNLYKRVKVVKKIKKEHSIHHSISLLDGPNIVNILSKCNDKIIISVRNRLSFFIKSSLKRFRIRVLYSKADTIVSLSKEVERDLVDEFKIKGQLISTIYNSCDVAHITKLANEDLEDTYKDLFDNYEVIVTVGRLEEQKAHWHLIRAFKKVKESRPNTKLLIFGKGSLEHQLKQLVLDLGLEEDVIFGGYVKNTFKYVSRSQLFVFSSIVEGLGNVILEAMACGLPIVSTDCVAGPREIISPSTNIRSRANSIEHGEYGLLTPVCDGVMYGSNVDLTKEESFLAQAILEILGNEKTKEKYKKASINRITDFSPEVISTMWTDIIGGEKNVYHN
ncbi:glycosyltransferase [Priestia aryabhattai]|uniref:glycosyltransferase n=1 Tax=Priestia aryabhattai TaxID=412384 RepID=UPI0005EC4515|nr:glycosyltransferase [Priestia aryabhattai]KJL04082.1 hypothetical protein N178_14820 [Priestia aryabhattai B8W22]